MDGSKVGPQSEVPLIEYTSRKRRQPVSTIIPALIVAASIIGHAIMTRYEVTCAPTACVRLNRMTGDIVQVTEAMLNNP